MREEMFRRTDQDRGGTITKEELTNVMSERGPSSAGVNIDQLFSQIDANEDGSIDGAGHHEFMSAKRRERPSAAEFAQKLCEEADGDGDGKLTRFRRFALRRRTRRVRWPVPTSRRRRRARTFTA